MASQDELRTRSAGIVTPQDVDEVILAGLLLRGHAGGGSQELCGQPEGVVLWLEANVEPFIADYSLQ